MSQETLIPRTVSAYAARCGDRLHLAGVVAEIVDMRRGRGPLGTVRRHLVLRGGLVLVVPQETRLTVYRSGTPHGADCAEGAPDA